MPRWRRLDGSLVPVTGRGPRVRFLLVAENPVVLLGEARAKCRCHRSPGKICHVPARALSIVEINGDPPHLGLWLSTFKPY